MSSVRTMGYADGLWKRGAEDTITAAMRKRGYRTWWMGRLSQGASDQLRATKEKWINDFDMIYQASSDEKRGSVIHMALTEAQRLGKEFVPVAVADTEANIAREKARWGGTY